MKLGVLVFPGSNCDYDCFHLAADVLGAKAKMIWHDETKLDVDAVIVPVALAMEIIYAVSDCQIFASHGKSPGVCGVGKNL